MALDCYIPEYDRMTSATVRGTALSLDAPLMQMGVPQTQVDDSLQHLLGEGEVPSLTRCHNRSGYESSDHTARTGSPSQDNIICRLWVQCQPANGNNIITEATTGGDDTTT